MELAVVFTCVILLLIVVIMYVYYTRTPSVNPCDKYGPDDTDLPKECLDRIWKDAGCLTRPVWDENWARGHTKEYLKNDAKAWATLPDEKHVKGCYGDGVSV